MVSRCIKTAPEGHRTRCVSGGGSVGGAVVSRSGVPWHLGHRGVLIPPIWHIRAAPMPCTATGPRRFRTHILAALESDGTRIRNCDTPDRTTPHTRFRPTTQTSYADDPPSVTSLQKERRQTHTTKPPDTQTGAGQPTHHPNQLRQRPSQRKQFAEGTTRNTHDLEPPDTHFGL